MIEDHEPFEGEDRYIQLQMRSSLYQIYERAFWANEYGQMGQSEWQRFEGSICGAKARFWDSEFDPIFTTEFIAFVESCDPNFEFEAPDF